MLASRLSLLGLALSLAAGGAIAANPPAASQPTKSDATHVSKEKRTCEKRSKVGRCEKWAAPAKTDAAKTKS